MCVKGEGAPGDSKLKKVGNLTKRKDMALRVV